MFLCHIIVKYFIDYGFKPSTIKRLSRIFGNCALVQSCILPKRLDCVYIHLTCRKMEQFYDGIPEDETSCVETCWSS